MMRPADAKLDIVECIFRFVFHFFKKKETESERRNDSVLSVLYYASLSESHFWLPSCIFSLQCFLSRIILRRYDIIRFPLRFSLYIFCTRFVKEIVDFDIIFEINFNFIIHIEKTRQNRSKLWFACIMKLLIWVFLLFAIRRALTDWL